MNQREAFTETVDLAISRGMPLNPGSDLGLDHLIDMAGRLDDNPDYSEAKIGRWLGWAQAAVVAAGVGVTLEDMKALNMRHAGGSE